MNNNNSDKDKNNIFQNTTKIKLKSSFQSHKPFPNTLPPASSHSQSLNTMPSSNFEANTSQLKRLNETDLVESNPNNSTIGQIRKLFPRGKE